jgi:endonuclease/exonuclease/phosphatase (EEP) superfamily protein YafD
MTALDQCRRKPSTRNSKGCDELKKGMPEGLLIAIASEKVRNLIQFDPTSLLTSSFIMAAKDTLKITSINVNGIAKSSRSNRILTELSLNSADIFFLQETHLHDSTQIESIKKQWKGVSLWEEGTQSSCGVAILFNNKTSVTIENVQLSGNGRFIAVDCTVNRINLRLVNIYSSTKEGPRRNFF